jgi:hypothetical protein
MWARPVICATPRSMRMVVHCSALLVAYAAACGACMCKQQWLLHA